MNAQDSIDYINSWVADINSEIQSQTVEIALLEIDDITDDVKGDLRQGLVPNQIAMAATSSDGFRKRVDHFLTKPKTAIEEVYQIYSQTRQELLLIDPNKIHETLLRISLDLENDKKQDVKTKVFRYLLVGKCSTRLGDEIKRPDGLEDKYFEILMDISRIIFETKADDELRLPWLSGKTDIDSLNHIKWEKRAGSLADYAGGAIGRAVSASVTASISPFIKIPDEASKAVALLFGLMAKKTAELAMYNELLINGRFYK